MSAKSIKKNYIYNLIYQMVILLTPIITTPYLSRVLQPDGVGLHSIAYANACYFISVVGLGTTTFGQREVAYHQDDKHGRSKAFWTVMSVRAVTFILCSVVYFIYAFNIEGYRDIALVQYIYVIYAAMDIAWFFQGMEEFKKLVLRNLLIKVVYLIFIFTCIKSKEDLCLYAFGLAAINLAGAVSMWFYLPKYIGKVAIKELQPWKSMPTIMQLFLPAIAMQVYTILDKTMLGIYTATDHENGYYEEAEHLVRMCIGIVTAMTAVIVPRMAYVFSKGDEEGVKKYLKKSMRFAWFMGMPVTVGIALISNILVPWFLGDGYEKCIPLMAVFSILVLVVGFSNVTGASFLVPTGRQNIYTISVVMGAVLNFCLNLILIPRFLSVGATIASITAEASIMLFQLIYIVYKTKIIKWSDCFEGAWRYIFASIAMFAAGQLMEYYFLKSNIISTFVEIILCAAVYMGVLALLRDDFAVTTALTLVKRVIHKENK